MHPGPGLVLALLIVLITTQVTRLLLPGRVRYAVALLVSVLGLAVAEIVAATGRVAGPSLGVVHPVLDILVIAGLQALAALMGAPGGSRR